MDILIDDGVEGIILVYVKNSVINKTIRCFKI